jgi:hypothetical protein
LGANQTLARFSSIEPGRENENGGGLVEPGSAAACAITHPDYTLIDGSQITSRQGSTSPRVFTKHDFVAASCRAAISFGARELENVGS